MRLAYIILAHNNISQLILLIDLLTLNNENFCFVHLDHKNVKKDEVISFKEQTRSRNCMILDNPIEINWGGFSMVEATIKMLGIIKEQKVKYNYISLISGSDLPIKNNESISQYLAVNSYEFYLNYFKLPSSDHWGDSGGNDRVQYYWFIDDIGYSSSAKVADAQKNCGYLRDYPKCIDSFYGGSQWWTISWKCAKVILEFLDKYPDLVKFFRYTNIPDETFFQTIIMNSSLRNDGNDSNLRYIDWSMQNDNPKIFDSSDYDTLLQSDKLFARKFDMNYNATIIFKVVNHTHPDYFDSLKC